MSDNKLSLLRQSIKTDPGGEGFFELLDLLSRETSSRAEGRELCLQRINQFPNDLKARLLFAKLLYLDGYKEHSVRELIEIRRRKSTPSIEALIKSFGPLATQFEGSQDLSGLERPTGDDTVGEIDFDLSVFDEEG